MQEVLMNARIHILAGACGIAALVAAGFLAGRKTMETPPAAAHGAFGSRLQPVLDGIGSTRDLAPVQLGEVHPATAPVPGIDPDKEKRHERPSRAR
jgi:hypothetical protein